MVYFQAGLFSVNYPPYIIILEYLQLYLQVSFFFTSIIAKMKVRVMLSIITLYFISYLIFIFPFDVLSSWLGNPTSLLEVFITTTMVFSLCLYYFRSKSTNKFIKIFVYEGFGIGTVSFFLILPLIAFDYLKIVSSYKLAIFFFFIQIPTIIYGYINLSLIHI